MSAILMAVPTRSESSRFLALGLMLASMVVLAQTATDRLEANRSFDDAHIDQIEEDAGLWRNSTEPDSSNQWRPESTMPMKRDSRVTWGYDSAYEELRERHYDVPGPNSFDFGDEERAGTLLRFNF